MQTVTLRAAIDPDGRLRLNLPAELPPGPVEVVIVIQPAETGHAHAIRELRGLGAEVWRGIDAQEYVSRIRDEWER